jgi:hypothetical protein
MSKGKKINDFFDIIDRPVYREIIALLRGKQELVTTPNNKLFPTMRSIEHIQLTAAEIKKNLFPAMNRGTFNTYLKKLVESELIKKTTKIRGHDVKIRVIYEAVPEDVFWEMHHAEFRKKMTNTKKGLLFHLDKLNKDLIVWNSDDNWPLADTAETARKLIIITSNCKLDEATGKTIIDYEKIYNNFTTPKEAVPSIQDFFEYKIEPVKKELENYLTMNSKNSKIKITVEYGDGEKVEIS